MALDLLEGADAFYDLRHQEIFKAAVTMWEGQQAIDLVTLSQWLKDSKLLDQIGGLPYLARLTGGVPSAANLEYYLEIVREKWLLRRLVRTCTETVARVYDFEGEVQELLDLAERNILDVRGRQGQSKFVTGRELAKDALVTVEALHERAGVLTGLATGFTDLDKITGGLQNGEMFTLAARPSMGKTSLALNVAEHVSLDLRVPVGMFSLEMTWQSLGLRLLCSRSRVSLRNVRDGFLAERDFPRITHAAGKIGSSPIYIDDTSALSIIRLRARARRMWQQFGIKLFVIDYLQLLNAIGGYRRSDNRQQEVSDISSGIKSLAKELNVPVLVLSQLSRDVEKDKRRRPRLSDLRESGSIEQDSDVVAFLYSAKEKDEDPDYESDAVPVNLYVAKQRNGPTGEVALTFLKALTRFESAARVSDADVPNDAQTDLI